MKSYKTFFLSHKKTIIVTVLAVLLCVGIAFAFFHGKNQEPLDVQLGFETEEPELQSDAWKDYGTTYEISKEQAHSGTQSLQLTSDIKNDARFIYQWNAQRDTYYKVSCWIKTENVGTENTGANLSVGQCYFYFGDITGTQDWTYVEGYFRVVAEKKVTLMLRLGGYSSENTGTVYFDDLSIEQISKLPAGIDVNSVNVVGKTTMTSQEKVEEYHYSMSYTALFLMLSFTLFLIYRAVRATHQQGGESFFRGMTALFVLFSSALLLRFIVAPVAIGFEGDVYLFEKWGKIMAQDIRQFYVNANAQLGIADYPPFYMYILGIIMYLLGLVEKVVGFFGLSVGSGVFKLAVKMPPLLADMVSAFLIYHIVQALSRTEKGKWLNESWSLFFAGLYLFNPMVLFDSVVWGQMDSFLAMLLLLAIYAVMKKKVTLSAVLFALAILTKPQGLFAGPVLLFYVLREGTIKQKIGNFFKCAGAILVTTFFITLPYVPLKEFGSFTLFKTEWDIAKINSFLDLATLVSGNFLFSILTLLVCAVALLVPGLQFLVTLFSETAGRYDYASVNGFNLFAFLGLNWEVDTYHHFLGISCYAWGMILLGVIVVLGGVLYMLLPKEYEHRTLLIALFLVVGIFVFTVRMHERYMFPAILLSLLLAVLDNSKFMLRIHALLTTTSFFNSLVILAKYNSKQDLWAFEGYKSIPYISAANILGFVLILIYVILQIAKVRIKKIGMEKEKEEPADEFRQSEGVLE